MADSSESTFTVISLGCRSNYYDSQSIKHALATEGMTYVPFTPGVSAGLYVINTCTVTSRADFDSRSWVRKAKQWNPDSTVVATGCYAQIQSARLVQEGADLVVGNLEKERLGEILRKVRQAGPSENPHPIPLPFREREYPLLGEERVRVRSAEVAFVPKVRRKGVEFHYAQAADQDRTRPVLKLQDGCDQCCSFCIIPTTRGHSRSLAPDAAVEQVRGLVVRGAREVVLSGINLSSYGEDLAPGTTLADLLARLETEDDSAWIRISSIEPSGLTEELLAVIRKSRKICPHFHVPLQSGDPDILRRMNRPYTVEQYSERIRALAGIRDDVSIGSDVMVGFPGETEAQFENTLRAVENLPFAYLHVFPYSVRPGTKAAKMEGRVDRKTRKRRSTELCRIGERKRAEFLRRQVGVLHEAIVESSVDSEGAVPGGPRSAVAGSDGDVRREWRATSRNYARMSFSGLGDLRNRIVHLRGVAVEGSRLRAVLENAIRRDAGRTLVVSGGQDARDGGENAIRRDAGRTLVVSGGQDARDGGESAEPGH